MRLVYVIKSLGNSAGMERVLCSKANYLAEVVGYQIFIITELPLPRDLFFTYSSAINIESLGLIEHSGNRFKKIILHPVFKFKFRRRLSKRIYSIKPDITISMFGEELSFLPRLRDGSLKIAEFHYSRNYLIHLIRSMPNLHLRWIRLLRASIFQFTHRVFAAKYKKVVLLTEKDRQLWGKKQNLVVIPNPLSFQTDKKSALENKKIIAVGRLIAQKGFDLLIEAFSKIAKKFPEWNLLIIGEGQDEAFLLGLINHKGLKDRVTILPPRKDIHDILMDSSIYALSSRYEGFGLVLTEAMECGVPCVAFDCECGPSEIINNNIDGFLVEDRNVIQFAEKLEILMSDNELRKRMGVQAKQNVKRFGIEKVMQHWTSLFNDLTA